MVASSYVNNCYSSAVHSVKEAIGKDTTGNAWDAYYNYLTCMQLMVQALKDEARENTDLKVLSHEGAIRLMRLTEQCLNRAHDILKNNYVQESKTTLTPKEDASRRLSHPTVCGPQTPAIQVRRADSLPWSNSSQAANTNNYKALVDALPTPPGSTSTQTRRGSFGSQNNAVFQAYQRRKTLKNQTILQKYNAANSNLSLFRQEAESMAITKAKERANHLRLLDRQKKMQLEVERRWNRRKSHLQRDKTYRQNLLAQILSFEEDQPWTKRLREHLQQNKDNTAVVVQVIETVLNSHQHPLFKVMKEIQYDLYSKIKPLVDDFKETAKLNEVNEGNYYLQPVESMKRLQQNIMLSDKNSVKSRWNVGSCQITDESRNSNISNNNVTTNSSSTTSNHDISKSIHPNNIPDSNSNVSMSDTKEPDTTVKQMSVEEAFNDLEDVMFSSESEDEGSYLVAVVESESNNTNDSSETRNPNEVGPSAQLIQSEEDDRESSDEEHYYKVLSPTSESGPNPLLQDVTLSRTPLKFVSPVTFGGSIDEVDYYNLGNINKQEDRGDEINEQDDNSDSVIRLLDSSNNINKQVGSIGNSNEQEDRNNNMNKVEDSRALTLETTEVVENGSNSGKLASLDEKYSGEKSDTNGSTYQTVGGSCVDQYESLHITPKTQDDDYEKLNKFPVAPPPKPLLPIIREPIYEEIGCVVGTEEECSDASNHSSSSTDSPLISRRISATSIDSPSNSLRISSHSIDSVGDMSSYLDTEFIKKMDNIVQELLFGIDRIHSVLLLTYEDMDTPIGKDQSYATLEKIFFKVLWSWMITMFRKMNWSKEQLLQEIMLGNAHFKPADMKVRQQYVLEHEENPYEIAIEELRQVVTMSCPLDKLECAVRTSKMICYCVEEYWKAQGADKPPSIGGDDLLPIFSFVVLKTQYAQLVAECHAMEEFIHESYLMGEEGYCLSTLHAALANVLTLKISR